MKFLCFLFSIVITLTFYSYHNWFVLFSGGFFISYGIFALYKDVKKFLYVNDQDIKLFY